MTHDQKRHSSTATFAAFCLHDGPVDRPTRRPCRRDAALFLLKSGNGSVATLVGVEVRDPIVGCSISGFPRDRAAVIILEAELEDPLCPLKPPLCKRRGRITRRAT